MRNAAGKSMGKRVFTFALVALSLASCKTLARGSSNDTPPEPTVVQVDNQGFLDMTIYASVVAGDTVVLTIPPI